MLGTLDAVRYLLETKIGQLNIENYVDPENSSIETKLTPSNNLLKFFNNKSFSEILDDPSVTQDQLNSIKAYANTIHDSYKTIIRHCCNDKNVRSIQMKNASSLLINLVEATCYLNFDRLKVNHNRNYYHITLGEQ